MLGLGWTEMLVIGVVALIVIGPKDLPVVMNRIGKIAGQIRRMGNDFQREINKTTGLDEVRNLRNSITAPLKKTSDEIRRDFNAMTPSGPKPSGVIKPADPKAESVVDEIKAAAGMTSPKPVVDTTPKPDTKVVATRVPLKAKAAPTAPVATSDLAPLKAAAPVKAPVAKKPAAKKPAAKPVAAKSAAAAPTANPAPKKRAAAKPKAAATDTGKAGDV